MQINKKILPPIGIAVVGAATLGGVALANATNSQSLADTLAQRFNLNKSDVQKVIDEHRDDKKEAHQQRYEDMLQKAVDSNKLTAEQRDKILAKHKELVSQMEANKDSFRDKTPDERKAAKDKLKADIEQWEKDNNIPSGYLKPMGHGGPRGHHGMMGGAPDVN